MAKHKRDVSRSRREDALQRDVEVEGQVRLQVIVRLVPSGGRQGVTRHLDEIRCRGRKLVDAVAHSELLPRWNVFETQL